ncbi:DNA-binding domain-containing protein [Jeongeupia naejangsanensis]|uniref:DNA-binding domain-containing protein n=1 Tax=Jeongeupia naejangsanensis TaxID=613195 RepID=A0ABS2BPB1_9NEIS|nr:DNA-binding domain-containing protein [Jeongeupia naejangsanensis]MBM3117250.1 putative DNA-binding domain-containing protein [Jeongeupia naejangsanensis]
MLSYADTLAEFAAGLVDDAFEPGCLTAASRGNLALYRNNVRLNRVDALENAFPTVAALVGRDWFRAMARAYVIAMPAASANLHDDGAALAGFLDGFAPAADLPYLADVARFDWARHRAWYAPDSAPLDRARLAALDEGGFGRCTLGFDPALALVVSSRWPIADIAAMHEGGASADPDAGGQAVLVWREGWRAVELHEAGWLSALLAGSPVGDALSGAEGEPELLLAWLFGHGLIRNLEENE